MIRFLFCVPRPLGEGLWTLAQRYIPSLKDISLHCVFYEIDDLERDIYKQLREATVDVKSEDGILVLGDLLGDKGATLSLSINHPNVLYLSGVNISMLLALSQIEHRLDRFQNLEATELLMMSADFLKSEAQKGILSSSEFVREAGEGSTIDFSTFDSELPQG